MKLFVFSIFDQAAGAYLRPYFSRSDDEGTRSFSKAAQDGDGLISEHPEDFTLFRVGTWDDNTGELDGSAPVKLVTALEVIAASRKIKVGQLEAFDQDLHQSPGGTQ